MNTKVYTEISNILSDNNIHCLQEIIQRINNQYPGYNYSQGQIHYYLAKMIKDNQCKRICKGLYQKP